VTELLQQLLNSYGLLYITLHKLSSDCPGRQHDTLGEYYESLGAIERDEPVLLVRISPDGEFRFLNKGEHDVAFLNEKDESVGDVHVWELPEDEFYFFRAFRPGLFQLEKELPDFLHGLGVVYAYAAFENYLSGIIATCLRAHPQLMGEKKQLLYAEVLGAATKKELVESLIGREVRDLSYLPITAVLDLMRKRFGFKGLKADYDMETRRISLIRNCIVHNGAVAEATIADEYPSQYKVGEAISLTLRDVDQAIHTLRTLAHAIDLTMPNEERQP
jgi:hypothetical protein